MKDLCFCEGHEPQNNLNLGFTKIGKKGILNVYKYYGNQLRENFMNTDIFRKLSYGVYVVTAWSDGKPMGCVANCVMQITSEPATFSVSINHDNFTHKCIKNTGKFAVSVLAETTDPKIIGTFGFKSGKDIDKFENVGYTVEDRLPVLTDSCGYLVCDVINTMETATHTVFLGELKAAGQFGDKRQMTYDYYHKVIKGSSPKNAPTYLPQEHTNAEEGKPKRKFRCEICGYEYEGDELPEDYACPICGVGPEHFTEVK